MAFPTETVYGLGADATNPEAVTAIFKAKGRPPDNPLIVHVADPADLETLVAAVTPLARDLMDRFWPGPLTVILRKTARVPDLVTAGLDTVALRMPAHPLALRLIALSGVPVAAPSANRSGRPSPTRGAHVVADLMGRVDAIIDGGPCAVGLESTVVDATGDAPVILRPGAVTREMLAGVSGRVELDPALARRTHADTTSAAPRSPGMKYTHYSPRARLVLAGTPGGQSTDDPATAARALMTLASRYPDEVVGVLCTDETAALIPAPAAGHPHLVVKTLGSVLRPAEMAANLFHRLREFDTSPVTLILAQPLPEEALGLALMNRLIKAAGYRWEDA